MATQIVIAKNSKTYNVDIEDLGLTVPLTGQLNLTDICQLSSVLTSKDLYNLVNTNILTINDGSSDLNKATALDFLTIEVFDTGGSLGADFEIIQLWNDNTQNINNSTPTRIKFDERLYYDANNYSHDQSTGIITVLTSGLYEVYYHINAQFIGNDCIVETYANFSGTVFTRSSGFLGAYRPSIRMITNKCLKELLVNDTIEVFSVRNKNTSAINTIQQKCFMSVIKLRNL